MLCAHSALFTIALTCAALHAGSSSSAAALLTDQAGGSRRLTIDGSKNPELFPEWFFWQTGLEALQVPPMPQMPRHKQIGVSEADLKILLRESAAFKDYERILTRELRASRAALKGKDEDTQQDAFREINLQYRHRILESRARVYAETSADGLKAFRKWVMDRLHGTTIYLSGRTLEYFHLPW